MENQNPPEKELAAPVLHPHPTILSVEQTKASIAQSKAIHKGAPHASSQFSPQLRNKSKMAPLEAIRPCLDILKQFNKL